MKLIVGLGNPGKEYAATRHNIGFRCINKLAKVQGIPVKQHGSKSQFGTGEIKGYVVVLAKPQTYMNLSGKAVKLLGQRFEITPEDIWVIHDDLDLPLGKLRLSSGGGSGGHKGVASIITELNNSSFTRIRIGIGRPSEEYGDSADYVLSDFSYDEKTVVEESILKATEATLCLLEEGKLVAMNKFN